MSFSTEYYTTTENLRETLNTFGVAIIPNVLPKEQCDQLNNDMWSYFENITRESIIEDRIDRNDTTTYRNIYKLFPTHSMLFQHLEVGHCQALWNVRQNPDIVNIFKTFWGVDDLIVSFDGLSFALPHEITKRGYYRNNNWLHCDQSFLRNGFECIQSWVTAFDVNEGDATLVVLEKSHLMHGECREKFNIIDKADWYKLNENEMKFYTEEKQCQLKKIHCPAGSMVFWDSRTIHSGCEALKNRKQPNYRCVAYLCYMPRYLSSSKNNKKRQEAFVNKRTSSHNATHARLFSKTPRTYGSHLPLITPIDPPILTDLGLSLI